MRVSRINARYSAVSASKAWALILVRHGTIVYCAMRMTQGRRNSVRTQKVTRGKVSEEADLCVRVKHEWEGTVKKRYCERK